MTLVRILAATLSLACVSACVAGGEKDSSPAPSRRSAPASAASAGTRAAVPDLRGMNAAMARDALARRGLSSVRFASAEPGVRFVLQSADWHVVRQSVAAGAKPAAGTHVDLAVRKGLGDAGAGPPPGSATMPRVVGKNGDTALSAMRDVGCWKAVLAAADTEHRMVLNPSDWTVTRQLVRAGTKFDPDSVVVLGVTRK